MPGRLDFFVPRTPHARPARPRDFISDYVESDRAGGSCLRGRRAYRPLTRSRQIGSRTLPAGGASGPMRPVLSSRGDARPAGDCGFDAARS
jgi:hypothetical protein